MPPDPRVSALPSPAARALAFAAILLGGVVGGFIGLLFVGLQCEGDCAVAKGVGFLVGAIVIASGVAVVAVLAMRAMGEWKRISEAELSGEEAEP